MNDTTRRSADYTTSNAFELELLRQELAIARDKERALRDTRRAVVNLLEDLDDDRARLARAEQEWRAAFDGIRDAIMLHDADARILRANRAYLALAGAEADAAVGRHYHEVFPRRDAPFDGCTGSGAETEFSMAEEVFRSRCYEVREFGFTLRVFEDVTERHRAEQQLRSRTDELAVANRALQQSLAELKMAEGALIRSERLATIGTLASGVAHELNNPLMGVLNYVDYAQGKMVDAKGREVLAKAARELQRMEGVVRNLLRLGRPSSESLVPTAASEPLARALDLLGPDLRKRQVEVSTELPPELPRVWANPAALQQVFLNLLLNAVDAMGGTLERRIAIRGRVEGGQVRIAVTDTGTGIAKDQEPHLFETFFSTKPEGQGTGLGLSISRRIMEGFGGALEYLPRPPPGATFVLTLRRADGPA